MGASSGQPTFSPSMPQTPSAPQAGLDFSGFSGAGGMADQLGNTNFSPTQPDALSTNLTNQFDSGSMQAQLNKPENNIMDQFKAGFGSDDAKKLAKDLAAAKQEQQKLTPVNTQGAGAGGAAAPVNLYAGMMPNQAPSGAMQAIQGSVPQMQQPMGIMGRI